MTISNGHILKRLWRGWLKFGHWLGNLMSWVWGPLFYYIILTPLAWVARCFIDPLALKSGRSKTFWTPKHLPELNMEWAKSQGSLPKKGEKNRRV